jgi:hypothetical protein
MVLSARKLPLILAIGLVTVGALGSLTLVVLAKFELSRTSDRIMAVSSRPKVLDAGLIIGARRTGRLLYVRGEDKFGRSVLSTFGDTRSNEPQFFSIVNGVVTSRLSQVGGKARFAEIIELTDRSEEIPAPMLAMCLGLALACFYSLRSNQVVAACLAAAGISALKVVTGCPTCPRPQVLGVDAAVAGFFLFALLAGLALARGSSRVRAWAGTAIVGAVALVLTWQIAIWWDMKTQCLPCAALGFLLAWTLGSSPRWLGQAPVFARSWQPALLFQAIPIALAILLSPTGEASNASNMRHLAALGMPRQIVIRSISEVGLQASGRARVVLIASKNCRPCELTVAALDGVGMKGIEYFYVSPEPPDSTHIWTKLPNSERVMSTPTTLLTDPSGKVLSMIQGARTDRDGLTGYVTKLESFISSRGKPNETIH